jgi:hypothetical protein
VLLQQLEYIASVRTQLPSETVAACKQRFKLISSSGSIQEAASLYLPPSNQAARELLLELAQMGQGLQLLALEFQQFWDDGDKRLALTKVLGLKHADAAAVVGALADFHSSSRSTESRIDEEQLMRHLKYLAAHTDILEDASNIRLLKQVKQAIQLPDIQGVYCCTSSLFFPLGEQFCSLEQELESGGMQFLSSTIAVAAYSSLGDSFSHRRMKELLLLLGVREPDVSTVAEFILQLYETPEAVAALTMERHMLHVQFLCGNLGKLTGQALQSTLRLYGQEQVAEEEGPAYRPAELSWPSVWCMDEPIKQQLMHCKVVFLNPDYINRCCQAPEVDPTAVRRFFVEMAGVQELGPKEVGVDATS